MRNLFYLLLITCLFACTKHSVTSSISSPPDNFYFKGTVNATAINWSSENFAGFKVPPMTENGIGILSNDCNNTYCKELDLIADIFTSPITSSGKYLNHLNISFIYATKAEDFTIIKSWLNPGNIPFGAFRVNINNPINDGVQIDYTDANGRNWSSTVRISDQNGSNFESLGLKDAAPDKPYQKTWTARFSCKIYSTVSCPPNVAYETMTITDAEICIPVFNKE